MTFRNIAAKNLSTRDAWVSIRGTSTYSRTARHLASHFYLPSGLLACCLSALGLLGGCAWGQAHLVRRNLEGGELRLSGNMAEAVDDANRQMERHCQGPFTVIGEREETKSEVYVAYVCGNPPPSSPAQPTSGQSTSGQPTSGRPTSDQPAADKGPASTAGSESRDAASTEAQKTPKAVTENVPASPPPKKIMEKKPADEKPADKKKPIDQTPSSPPSKSSKPK